MGETITIRLAAVIGLRQQSGLTLSKFRANCSIQQMMIYAAISAHRRHNFYDQEKQTNKSLIKKLNTNLLSAIN